MLVKVGFYLTLFGGTTPAPLENFMNRSNWKQADLKKLPKLAMLFSAAVLVLSSCVYTFLPDFAALTEDMNVTNFEGERHQLLFVYMEKSLKNATNVNIYLEGDGRAWKGRTKVSRDPTPLYPLALDLMRQDPGPAYYLTRPCYQNLKDENCTPELWTHKRYSNEVLDELARAIQFIAKDNYRSVTVIGYSGGGALALLLVDKVPEITRVVTIAGNLDTDAWTNLHDYSPLKGSLNPALTKMRDEVEYWHFAGREDKNIPPELGRKVHGRKGHKLFIIEGFNHRCCWVENWPVYLQQVEAGKH